MPKRAGAEAAMPDAVAACVVPICAQSPTWNGVVARRDNSRVHRIGCGAQSIAVKECVRADGSPDRDAAKREFAALHAVWRPSPDGGEAPLVPQPLLLSAEHGSYAMSWAPGRSATELIVGGGEHAVRAGECAGRWLRRFHGLRPLSARACDFESKVPFALQLASGAPRRDPTLDRAARVLASTARTVAAEPLPASWVHGDMKSDNVLIDGSRVTGIDVQVVDENSVVYDLAPFLNHLALLRWSARGVVHRRAINAAADAFLGAYCARWRDWTRAIVWLRAYLLAQSVARALPRWLDRVAASPARVELGRLVDQLSARA